MWPYQSPDGSVSHTNGETEGEIAAKEPESPLPVQNNPPEQMTIPIDTKPETKSAKSTKHKSPRMKRVSSAGHRTESVLQTRTGNLKEYYSLGRKLGQGQFGTTFLCVKKSTGKEYACKSTEKRKLLTDEDDVVAVHVVMELCAGGELFDRIIQRGHYTERKAAALTRIIVGVVEACHSLGVMHRDLKPENFLFVNQQEDALLKTIDFGLSIFFKPGEKFTDVVGSPYYVAPEVLQKHYGPEADVIAESLSEEEIGGLKKMFKMIDTDNSGQITFEELKAGLKRVGANIKEDSEIYDLMQAWFDKDGSGYITLDELQQACEEFGIKDVRLEEMIREVDQDNDGRIDYNEFVAMMQKGHVAGAGKKGLRNDFSFGFREALKL
ncbi:Calcium-dependent protein kinase 1 [Hibiscus syriacus]|uniref:non-specific serine/threonine protein kinase n=1 Tax=Hibiscus syriacus TaxID=106335 RepID=A0A6A3B8T7_HIBSY|nr:Calcium-dependent protein kinase 1 [Hibiscus syriacus]